MESLKYSAIAAATLVLLAFAIISLRTTPHKAAPPVAAIRPQPPSPPPTLVIRSLENRSGPGDAYIAAGLTEALRSRLGAPKNEAKPVLAGWVESASGKIRLTATLSSGTAPPFWTQTFERNRRDLYMLPDEAAQGIAAALKLPAPAPSSKAPKPAAYDDYLRGRFEAATVADPNFAPAWAQLAIATSSTAAAQKALALDPLLAEAHFAQAFLLWTPENHWPHAQAIAEYRRAIQLNPNYAPAHDQLALVLQHTGALDEAQAEAQKARAIDPANPGYRLREAVCLLNLGQYRDSLDILHDLDPAFSPQLWYFHAAWAHLELRETTRASQYINDYLDANVLDTGGLIWSMQAVLQARFRNDKQANQAIAEALANRGDYAHFHHAEYNLACAYALMGNQTEAVRWLREAINDGFPCAALFLTDPNLKSLARNAEFQKAVSRDAGPGLGAPLGQTDR